MHEDDHLRNLKLQAEEHPLVMDRQFATIEAYVLHLIHRKAYEETARIVAGKRVLDLGCNVGYGTEVMLATAASAAGLDVSPRSVEAARTRLGKAVDIRLYNGLRSDFPDQSFDAVVSLQVIEHISDYNTYFSEILRLLRPGGVALLTTPNACLRLEPGMKPWYEFHVREFTPKELHDLLATRFESVEVRGLFGNEAIYRIEYQRLAAARNAAKPSVVKSVKRVIRRSLPWVLAIRDRFRKQVPSVEFSQDTFSTDDLFYGSDSLEESLDLMAICRKHQTQ